jgi:hypothetical protein
MTDVPAREVIDRLFRAIVREAPNAPSHVVAGKYSPFGVQVPAMQALATALDYREAVLH